MDHTTTKIAGTFLELIAAISGLWFFKTAGKAFRLLALLLLYGFLTDLFCWQFREKFPMIFIIVLALYYLIEAIAFIQIIAESGFLLLSKKAIKIVQTGLFILFLGCYIYPALTVSPDATYSGLFSFLYLGSASLLAAKALLHLSEKTVTITLQSAFYLITGIFIYCFCSFFIDTFINDSIRESIWWVHDVANMIAYGFFIAGFIKEGKSII